MCVLYMAKLSNEKRKNSSFTKKKRLVGLAPGVGGEEFYDSRV